mmetsp:Transcript_31003/g.89597  ORF Transcript_31003/g.89597 Transcript_31003/m.89597 type:complete len:204 (+) Transcript_31003:1085-1696(+)
MSKDGPAVIGQWYPANGESSAGRVAVGDASGSGRAAFGNSDDNGAMCELSSSPVTTPAATSSTPAATSPRAAPPSGDADRVTRRGPRQFRHPKDGELLPSSPPATTHRRWSRSRARGGGGSDCVRASSSVASPTTSTKEFFTRHCEGAWPPATSGNGRLVGRAVLPLLGGGTGRENSRRTSSRASNCRSMPWKSVTPLISVTS